MIDSARQFRRFFGGGGVPMGFAFGHGCCRDVINGVYIL